MEYVDTHTNVCLVVGMLIVVGVLFFSQRGFVFYSPVDRDRCVFGDGRSRKLSYKGKVDHD